MRLDIEIIYPWEEEPLDKWDIVGMNHYYLNDTKFLYIAMTKSIKGKLICIKSEATDSLIAFDSLRDQALVYED